MKKLTFLCVALLVIALSIPAQAAITSSTKLNMVSTDWASYNSGALKIKTWDDPNSAIKISNSSAEGFDRQLTRILRQIHHHIMCIKPMPRHSQPPILSH